MAKKYASDLFTKLDVASIQQAVFTGFKLGIIDSDVAIQGLDPLNINTLTPRNLEILQTFTDNGGEISSIGRHLGITEGTMRNALQAIAKKLGARNRIQAGMLYLVARDRGLLTRNQFE